MVENIIKGLPLFAGLDREECLKLADICQVNRYKAGELVFDQSSMGDSLQIIKRGKIKISLDLKSSDKKGDSTLSVLEAGKFFGILSFLEPKPHTATAEALEDTELIQLSKEKFDRFCEDDPHGGYLILHKIGLSVIKIVREMDVMMGDICCYLFGSP